MQKPSKILNMVVHKMIVNYALNVGYPRDVKLAEHFSTNVIFHIRKLNRKSQDHFNQFRRKCLIKLNFHLF